MKFVVLTAAVAFAALSLGSAANAADARLSDCINLSKQANTALEAAQPGSKTDAARNEIMAGRSYCSQQMFAQGVAHYSKALQLLGKA